MTVVCINDNWKADDKVKGNPCPKIGDIDDVVDILERWGNTFYILAAYPKYQGFLSTHFVDIPDTPAEVIEETEMVEA